MPGMAGRTIELRGGMNMLHGFATKSGTLAYAKRYADLSFQVFGQDGLFVSEAGFGGYRVHRAVPEHAAALNKALSSGINLIDTSANYAGGGSEQLIGHVLQDLAAQGELRREEVVIVSKGGYLQGDNYLASQVRSKEGRPFPDLVPYAEGLEHCIHPEFLAEQIGLSLERLGLETIDCYLLHNPEYYLKWAQEAALPVEEARTEYLRRIQAAFQYLEQEVASGRIGCYGISSNTFVRPAQEYDFTPLASVWAIAEAISPAHHFRAVELPCNLFETGAVTEPNQPGGKSVLQFAAEQGLAVLINRPLNAIQGDQLIRLAENVYQGKAAQEAIRFRKRVAALDSAWQDAATLGQLALRTLRSTQGVTAVLVGMRQVAYVDDVLQELGRPCLKAERRAAWERLKQLL